MTRARILYACECMNTPALAHNRIFVPNMGPGHVKEVARVQVLTSLNGRYIAKNHRRLLTRWCIFVFLSLCSSLNNLLGLACRHVDLILFEGQVTEAQLTRDFLNLGRGGQRSGWDSQVILLKLW